MTVTTTGIFHLSLVGISGLKTETLWWHVPSKY